MDYIGLNIINFKSFREECKYEQKVIFKRSAWCFVFLFFSSPKVLWIRKKTSFISHWRHLKQKVVALFFIFFLNLWFSQMWWLFVFCAVGFKMKHASGTWTLLWEVNCLCLAAIPPMNVSNWVPRDRPEIWECTWFLCKLKLLFPLYLSLCSFSKEKKWQNIFFFWILD